MKRFVKNSTILITSMMVFCFAQEISGQTFEASWFIPTEKLTSSRVIQFGEGKIGGFMDNIGASDYGDGDDFTLYANDQRDLVLRTRGNVILQPSSTPGNIGLFTTNPQFDFDLQNKGRDIFRLGNSGESFTIDVAAGSGLVNLVSGAKSARVNGQNTFAYTGGRGSSRILLNDGEIKLYVGNQGWGVQDEVVEYKEAIVALGRSANRVGIFRQPEFDLDINAFGGNAMRIGSGTGDNNALYFDISAGAGIANIVAGARHRGGQNYAFGGTRGASRIQFDDGELNFYVGQETGIQDSLVEWTRPLHLNAAGQVGINTTDFPDDPDYYLAVDGKGMFEEVRVQLSENWPDYVFEDNYQLMPLAELDQYIDENGHLPNIPSAEEVYEEGIESGAMDAKLLEKIEELTMYLLEQQKTIQDQQAQIDALKTAIEK